MPTRELVTKIDIAASPDRVWEVLTDFAAYGEWNPFLTDITGKPKKGAGLVVEMAGPTGKPVIFRPTVLTVEPGKELRWRGSLFLPRLFDGEHVFLLEETDGGTHLVHCEGFRGILVPLLWKGLSGSIKAGFEAMNEALKKRVEG